ncbi:MAG: hypothetical protein E5X64_30400, partial [Mesorhizobium sp.]
MGRRTGRAIGDGDLLIDGVRANDIDPSERGLAMVFQSNALWCKTSRCRRDSAPLCPAGHLPHKGG